MDSHNESCSFYYRSMMNTYSINLFVSLMGDSDHLISIMGFNHLMIAWLLPVKSSLAHIKWSHQSYIILGYITQWFPGSDSQEVNHQCWLAKNCLCAVWVSVSAPSYCLRGIILQLLHDFLGPIGCQNFDKPWWRVNIFRSFPVERYTALLQIGSSGLTNKHW